MAEKSKKVYSLCHLPPAYLFLSNIFCFLLFLLFLFSSLFLIFHQMVLFLCYSFLLTVNKTEADRQTCFLSQTEDISFTLLQHDVVVHHLFIYSQRQPLDSNVITGLLTQGHHWRRRRRIRRRNISQTTQAYKIIYIYHLTIRLQYTEL